MTSNYDTLREGDARVDAATRITGEAFGATAEKAREWVDNAGHANWRVWQSDGRVQGALALYPMGQWFGGRSLPMWGVACVGIDAADRGTGVGSQLMQAAVREMHDKRVPLSTLFPAVQGVYRRAGYERAGSESSVELRLREIAPIDRRAQLRQGTVDDEPQLEILEQARAAQNDGNVDRSPLMWRRSRTPGGSPTRVHVVEEDDQITAYVRWREVAGKDGHYLYASEMVATSPASARRLLAFFADNAAQLKKLHWRGGVTDPIVCAATSLCSTVNVDGPWMLRLTHLEAALTGRGYAPGLTAEIHLDVADELCTGNAGRWVLRVAGGRGTVARGGEGRIGLHVRQLATIFTGHAHPRTVRRSFPVSGSDADLAQLGAVFAGCAPWMQDAF